MNITIESLDRICKDFPETTINIRVSNADIIYKKVIINGLNIFTPILYQDNILALKHLNGTVLYLDNLSFADRLEKIATDIINKEK